jgi:hypothetical protein
MKLSPAETRFIARCRKFERQWPFWRWISLLIGISFWPVSFYILFRLASDEHIAPSAFIALQEDVFWIMNLTCSWLVVSTIVRWRGDLRTTLLLKLLEAQEGCDSQPSASSNGGPAMPSANSGAAEGPPSVS